MDQTLTTVLTINIIQLFLPLIIFGDIITDLWFIG